MIHRRSSRVLLIVAAFALFLVPVAAIAAAGFTDVDDDSVFVADIQWMKDNGITKGCNPPTNDRFCPGSNVTREQMSAFMHRLAVSKVVDAATAVEADNADTLDGKDSAAFLGTTEKAADSDKLDGKDSAAFVEHGDIVMATDGHNWTAWASGPPSRVRNYMTFTEATGDGGIGIGLTAPTSIDGIEYGLKSVEVCASSSSGGYITNTRVFSATADPGYELLVYDGTDRTVAGCYTLDVNSPAPYGAGIGLVLGGGASVELHAYSVRSTWTPVADLPAPLGVTDISDDSNNG